MENERYKATESVVDLGEKAAKSCGGSFGRNEKYDWCKSFPGISWYNRVNINDFTSRDEALLKEIAGLCRDDGAQRYLSYTDGNVYDGFAADMEAYGIKLQKRQLGMLYDLKSEGASADKNTGKKYIINSHIRLINDDELEAWTRVSELGFNKSGILRETVAYREYEDIYHLGYFEDGRLVGTTLFNICGDDGTGRKNDGGIHEVTVLDEFRRKGIASELIKACIVMGTDMKLDFLSLQASVYGEPVYRRLGFTEVEYIYNCR